jgi:hypothetical protein
MSKIATDDGSVAGCYGTGIAVPPNNCRTCGHHSDHTCEEIRIEKARQLDRSGK